MPPSKNDQLPASAEQQASKSMLYSHGQSDRVKPQSVERDAESQRKLLQQQLREDSRAAVPAASLPAPSTAIAGPSFVKAIPRSAEKQAPKILMDAAVRNSVQEPPSAKRPRDAEPVLSHSGAHQRYTLHNPPPPPSLPTPCPLSRLLECCSRVLPVALSGPAACSDHEKVAAQRLCTSRGL